MKLNCTMQFAEIDEPIMSVNEYCADRTRQPAYVAPAHHTESVPSFTGRNAYRYTLSVPLSATRFVRAVTSRR